MIAATAAQIAALRLDATRPLLVVDADEVLVHFAKPFAKWLRDQDWRLQLHEYRLLHAIRRADGDLADPETTDALIRRFIDEETLHQPATPGAVACLNALSAAASIVILTNVPLRSQHDRIRNLAGHGMPFPVIANSGLKGAALAALAQQTTAPVAFIDDNPDQIASAAEHADHLRRLHFTGCALVRNVLPFAAAANFRPDTWDDVTADLLDFLT